MNTLYVPIFLIVHHSCSRVAWFYLSERFVGFKETGLLSFPKFPLQSISDSSVISVVCAQSLGGNVMCYLLDPKVLIPAHPLPPTSLTLHLCPVASEVHALGRHGIWSRKRAAA